MSRLLSSLLVAVFAVGCTFNVHAFDGDVPRAESDAEPFTRLRADLGALGAPADGAQVTVRGSERDTAAIDLRIGGLLGDGVDDAEVTSGVQVDWPLGDDSERELRVGYDGPWIETLWVEELAIELPLHTELDLIGDADHVLVEGLDGFVGVTTESGSIFVSGAGEVRLEAGSGSIAVHAQRGQLTTGSGTTTMTLTGPVTARAGSGSILGEFDGGGDLETGSGSIDVELTTTIDRDSSFTAGSGSIVLSVPPGAAFQLETETGSGSVHIDAGGMSHHGEDFVGAVNGGGPFVLRMQTGSGSIHVVERVGA